MQLILYAEQLSRIQDDKQKGGDQEDNINFSELIGQILQAQSSYNNRNSIGEETPKKTKKKEGFETPPLKKVGTVGNISRSISAAKITKNIPMKKPVSQEEGDSPEQQQ